MSDFRYARRQPARANRGSPNMNSMIVSFLIFGALFGLATYQVRHLFSEGNVSRSDNGERGPMTRGSTSNSSPANHMRPMR
jgi:hypothetical protein